MKKIISIVLIAMLAGCAASQKHQTMKEESNNQWNQARASIYLGLAKQQYESGDFDRSRQTVNQALGMEPKDVPSLLLSAKLWIEAGQLEAAERQLEQVRTIDAKSAEADYLSGIVYQRWQMPAEALAHYTAASDKAPAELAYIMARAEMLVTLDRQSEALTLLQSKAQYFEHSAALRDAIGQLLVDTHKYADAVDMLRQASILADDDLAIKERLGLAMYYAKQYRDAVDVLAALVAKPEYASRADVMMAIGDCDLQLGKYHDAMNWFQSAGQANPNSAEVWRKATQTALEMNDVHLAQITVSKALALDAQNGQTQLMLGYVRLRENRMQDALKAFITANTLDPNDALSITMTGYVYEKTGLKNAAQACYARALQIHPGDQLTQELMRNMHG